MSLIRLFEIVEEKSDQLRKTNPQADGQQLQIYFKSRKILF